MAAGGKCGSCNKDQSQLSKSLKTCAKCKRVQYCSRECQKKDWKSHKRACALATPDPSASVQPRFVIDKPFHALQKGSWLYVRPEQDVYQLLSDTFRMRREDKYKYEQFAEKGSVYAGGSASSELQNFRRFLLQVTELDAKRPKEKRLLPSWWSQDRLEKCVEVATTNQDAMVGLTVEKHDIQEFYKQDDMPMQLRMFGEALDGTKIMGQSGAGMLQMKVALEVSSF